MKRMVIIAVLLSGCSVVRPPMALPTAHVDDAVDMCPDLPMLREDASRKEYRLWLQSIVALYVQCARSK